MSLDIYAENILDELRHPQNQGQLDDFDVQYDATNASCGDSFKIQVKLDATKKQVRSIAWQGSGCAISTAAMSQVSSLALGKSVQQVLDWDKTTMLNLLGLASITVGRERCLLVGLAGLQTALNSLS